MYRYSLLIVAALGVATSSPAAIITGETATSSTDLVGFNRGHAHAVDDSGLTAGDNSAATPDQSHTASPDAFMWLSAGNCCGSTVDNNPYFAVDLGAVYDVTGIRVWNYNESGGGDPFVKRGVQAAKVSFSESSPPVLGAAGSVPVTIPIAPGTNDYTGSYFDLTAFTGGQPARFRYFLMDIDSNYGSAESFYGLSEIQFDGVPVPEPSSMGLMLLSMTALAARRRRVAQ